MPAKTVTYSFRVEGVDPGVVASVAQKILGMAREAGYEAGGPIPLPNKERPFEKPVLDVLKDVPEVITGVVVRKQLVVVTNPADEWVRKIVVMHIPATTKLGVSIRTKRARRRKQQARA